MSVDNSAVLLLSPYEFQHWTGGEEEVLAELNRRTGPIANRYGQDPSTYRGWNDVASKYQGHRALCIDAFVCAFNYTDLEEVLGVLRAMPFRCRWHLMWLGEQRDSWEHVHADLPEGP